MRSDRSAPVILVGFAKHPAAIALAGQLRSYGFDVAEAPALDDLPRLLRGSRRAAVAVYSPSRTKLGHQVLEQVAGAGRNVPVVVIVDETDFGEYYSLMSDGAKEYFGIREQPEVILRGLAWAANAGA